MFFIRRHCHYFCPLEDPVSCIIYYSLSSIVSRRASDGDHASKLSTQSEHIYARPSSLLRSYGTGSRLDTKRSRDRHSHSRFNDQVMADRHSVMYGTGSLYRSHTTIHRYPRRPRLVPDRWGSVPLPNPSQYDSIIRLSAHSLLDQRSQKDVKYVLESNVWSSFYQQQFFIDHFFHSSPCR